MSLIPPLDAPSTTDLFGSLVQELAKGLLEGIDAPAEGAENPRERLLPFLVRVNPEYRAAWVHTVVAAELERWWATDGARLILVMPPQHGKTELASRALPAWILGKAPDTRIIATTYSDEHAANYNLDVQRYIDSPAYAEVFPGTRLALQTTGDWRLGRAAREFVRARRTSHLFEVVGRRGFLRSAGIGGGIGGLPADVLLVDDPIKDRVVAESPVHRQRIWDWYKNVARRRLKPPGKVLIITTRWHQDDLVGMLLESGKGDPLADQFRVVRFPAIAETVPPLEGEAESRYPRHPDDRREDGEALWPERFPLPELRAARAEMTGYEWDGLMQGRPTRPGGLVFKRADFQLADALPALVPGCVRVRFWDVAGTEAEEGKKEAKACWTVGVLMCRFPDKRIFVEDVIRAQYGSTNVDDLIYQTAVLDGRSVLVREEREPGSSGKAVVNARARDLMGWDYKGVPSDENKVLRWRALASQTEARNVWVLNRPWAKCFIDEMADASPGARLKDQPDAASGAFLEIAQRPRPSTVTVRLAGFGASQ